MLGLSEVQREDEDEDTMILNSGYLFYFCEGIGFPKVAELKFAMGLAGVDTYF